MKSQFGSLQQKLLETDMLRPEIKDFENWDTLNVEFDEFEWNDVS